MTNTSVVFSKTPLSERKAQKPLRRKLCSGLILGALAGCSPEVIAARARDRSRELPAYKVNPYTSRLAAAPARAIRVNYDGYLITGFGSTRIASAVMDFIPKNGRYLMELTVRSMLADLSYTSVGRVDRQGLHPEKYSEHRKVAFRSARSKQVQYVVTKNPTAINRHLDGKLTVPPNTQDRLSLLIHFSLMAQADPDLLTPGRQISVPFARVNAVSSSRWSAGPVKQVRLDDGDTETKLVEAFRTRAAQRVARVADKIESVDVAFWLSADEDRLPLILQFSENGRSLKFVWTG